MQYPAVPLIVHDPYFSIWSFSDTLNDSSWQHHWTGSSIGMMGILRIDGKAMTFSGNPTYAPAMKQTSLNVLPTRTIYQFECDAVRLTLTYLTPALPHKLDVMARPLTYLIFELESLDGAKHDAEVYYDCGGEPCVHAISEEIQWGRTKHPRLELMSLFRTHQDILMRSGDNQRIEWGRFYLALQNGAGCESAICPNREMRSQFAATGHLPNQDYINGSEPVRMQWVSMGAKFSCEVTPGKKSGNRMMVAYDDIYSIEYLGRRLPGYWRQSCHGFGVLLDKAESEYEALREECEVYDAKLMADAARIGGEDYAKLCAISFRQAIAAHKLTADIDGTLLFFSKENFSNGCIATVDVTYPSAPLFLLTQPKLVEGMLTPILAYAESCRWRFPFAPHDLGTYPLANGQVYGGGEFTDDDQMPVEECGNMLLLAGALAVFHRTTDYIVKHEAKLRQWAEYLLDKGYDPENQLCTDDFAGHLAHNTNLSLKAILALGAWGKIEKMLGHDEAAQHYLETARSYAERWTRDAKDGDHYRLAFDQPGSWSQKYNLVWDRLLDLNLFPTEVAEREMAFYRAHQERYGLPLDSRKSYTKLDWTVWSATLTGKRDDFAALIAPLRRWLEETPTRVPLTDWFETTDGKQVGFQARSVVGGVFIGMLGDAKLREDYREML